MKSAFPWTILILRTLLAATTIVVATITSYLWGLARVHYEWHPYIGIGATAISVAFFILIFILIDIAIEKIFTNRE